MKNKQVYRIEYYDATSEVEYNKVVSSLKLVKKFNSELRKYFKGYSIKRDHLDLVLTSKSGRHRIYTTVESFDYISSEKDINQIIDLLNVKDILE